MAYTSRQNSAHGPRYVECVAGTLLAVPRVAEVKSGGITGAQTVVAFSTTGDGDTKTVGRTVTSPEERVLVIGVEDSPVECGEWD
jgi:hypothetical protein